MCLQSRELIWNTFFERQ